MVGSVHPTSGEGQDGGMLRTASTSQDGRARIGRTPSTTHGAISHIALTLFLENGFDQTTIDDIARAAGIGRRTFFRYFASKNDLPWGEFDAMLAQMRAHLATLPEDLSIPDALRAAVLEFNRFPAAELPYHRSRMWLLLNTPTLMAHSTLRYAAWREVIADFVAARRGVASASLDPQAIAWVCLGVSLAGYEQWLADPAADLQHLLAAGFDAAESLFAAPADS